MEWNEEELSLTEASKRFDDAYSKARAMAGEVSAWLDDEQNQKLVDAVETAMSETQAYLATKFIGGEGIPLRASEKLLKMLLIIHTMTVYQTTLKLKEVENSE